MEYQQTKIKVMLDPQSPNEAEVNGYLAIGSGLGYFIDPKPEEPEYFCTINGKDIYKEPDETRYCPTHMASGMGFPLWFYQEKECRRFIELMAPVLPWTLPLEEMQKLPQWANMGKLTKELADKATVRWKIA